MKRQFKIVLSPLFLMGLCLLLINDFYLKIAFGNWLTGKLSDVAGLFIFPLFLGVCFQKQKKLSFIATGLLFTIWKLPIVDGLIEWFNSWHIYIGRTVDYTDLFTLVILPLSYYYQQSNFTTIRLSPSLVSLVSIFAFCATNFPPRKLQTYEDINKVYELDYSKDQLVYHLNHLAAKEIASMSRYAGAKFNFGENEIYSRWNNDTLRVFLDAKFAEIGDTIENKSVLAEFVVGGNGKQSSLTFIKAFKYVRWDDDKDYKNKAIKIFERKVVKKLKQRELE